MRAGHVNLEVTMAAQRLSPRMKAFVDSVTDTVRPLLLAGAELVVDFLGCSSPDGQNPKGIRVVVRFPDGPPIMDMMFDAPDE